MALTNLGLTTAANEACISLGAGLARILPFAHSLNAEAARRGEIVKVPVYATEAAEFDATSNNYGQQVNVVGVDVAVDKHPVAGFEATDKQLMQSDVNFFADGGRAAARAIARKMNRDFFGMVKGDGTLVGANYTVTPSTKAGWTNLYAVACDDDIDPNNAALVLKPEKYAEVMALVGDAAIIGTDALASGVFKGGFAGFGYGPDHDPPVHQAGDRLLLRDGDQPLWLQGPRSGPRDHHQCRWQLQRLSIDRLTQSFSYCSLWANPPERSIPSGGFLSSNRIISGENTEDTLRCG